MPKGGAGAAKVTQTMKSNEAKQAASADKKGKIAGAVASAVGVPLVINLTKLGAIAAALELMGADVGKIVDSLVKVSQFLDLIGPGLTDLDKHVLAPYLASVKDSEKFMKGFEARLKSQGLTADAATPHMEAPNVTPQEFMRYAMAMNLPIVGSQYKALALSLYLYQYEIAHKRGYATELDKIIAASGLPASMGAAMPVANQVGDMASDIPKWFLK